MAEAEDATTLVCEECGQAVTLARGDYRSLRASCACDDINIRADDPTPMEWSQ